MYWTGIQILVAGLASSAGAVYFLLRPVGEYHEPSGYGERLVVGLALFGVVATIGGARIVHQARRSAPNAESHPNENPPS